MTINIAALQYAFLYNALKTCAFLLWKLKVLKKQFWDVLKVMDLTLLPKEM